ncbi:FAD-binding oxidoreductase [Puniceicoccales bacterium CK1056]|uniref:FAD-binding oxidoreductase n=1 Tax=Oceanipulchritudo coccoides TaxID=2706888 RepID=A0A6B2LZC0_9BACT|nr:FAD-dependent oxidoreductase [Oceanipulchritudo coccoides]NDV60880.1 FAD-binding oxidoreductase [Oceanipulchritudo coccoides]
MQAPVKPVEIVSNADRIRIIGQGLTGSLLALALHEKGIPFVVQDVSLPGTASPVAPGIVNPLAGRHFRPPERIDELLAEIGQSMALVRKHLGTDIWNPCPILRMFAEPTQIDRFERTLSSHESKAFVEERFLENTFPHLNDVFGSFLTKQGGWANLPLLCSAMRDWLKKDGRLIEQQWDPNEAEEAGLNEVLCFCEGWQVANNSHWSFIPHNPAKGEMLIVRFEEELPRDRIYNQGCWVQPIEEDLWRVGATYSWSNFEGGPSLDGAEDLQERLHLLTQIPFHVQDQVAGVRPIVEDYNPVIGQHPEKANWFILNAMGSKGVLQAPMAVNLLARILLEGKSPPSEWAVSRFT